MQYSGDKAKLLWAIRNLPGILSGRVADPTGVVQQLQLRMATQLLSKIQQAFLAKSQGEMGEDGIQWQPLSPVTIERRRQGRETKKQMTWKARKQNLSADEKKEFEREYRTRLSKLVTNGVPRAQAASLARAQAANVMRGKGANIPTRRDILGSRDVSILIDTGELYRSFSPGVPGDGQIVETLPGSVTVGTNKKPWHHEGTAKIPARPYWPPGGDLPDIWWEDILGILQDGVRDILSRTR